MQDTHILIIIITGISACLLALMELDSLKRIKAYIISTIFICITITTWISYGIYKEENREKKINDSLSNYRFKTSLDKQNLADSLSNYRFKINITKQDSLLSASLIQDSIANYRFQIENVKQNIIQSNTLRNIGELQAITSKLMEEEKLQQNIANNITRQLNRIEDIKINLEVIADKGVLGDGFDDYRPTTLNGLFYGYLYTLLLHYVEFSLRYEYDLYKKNNLPYDKTIYASKKTQWLRANKYLNISYMVRPGYTIDDLDSKVDSVIEIKTAFLKGIQSKSDFFTEIYKAVPIYGDTDRYSYATGYLFPKVLRDLNDTYECFSSMSVEFGSDLILSSNDFDYDITFDCIRCTLRPIKISFQNMKLVRIVDEGTIISNDDFLKMPMKLHLPCNHTGFHLPDSLLSVTLMYGTDYAKKIYLDASAFRLNTDTITSSTFYAITSPLNCILLKHR